MGTRNNERFRDFVDGHVPAAPLLPAVHITTVGNFSHMLETGEISLTRCRFYKRDLAYFFYGKPVYKLSRGRKAPAATRLVNDAAVCLILDLAKLPMLSRVFALDTGAYFGERYDDFMPEGIHIDDFELEPNLSAPARVVSSFFGDNRQYFSGQRKGAINHPPTDAASEAYAAILASQVSNSFDERACTCEIQLDTPVRLTADNLLSVIMPDRLNGDPSVRDALRALRVKPILYWFKLAEAKERTEVIYDKAGDYYAAKGYFA